MLHEHHAQIDSTNEKAVRVWRQQLEQFPHNPPEPVVISADVQTAGRGRQGRMWRSPIGGLWMTLAWPAPADADAYRSLPLVAGLAVAEAISDVANLDAAIKWPNDLLIDNMKVCGILCEYQPLIKPAVIVGIGVNVNLKTESLGRGLRNPPTTLRDRANKPVKIGELRRAVIRRLTNRLSVYERDGLKLMLPSIRKRLAWLGQTLTCDLPGGKQCKGKHTGIDDEGKLLLTDAAGKTTALDIGEIVHVSLPMTDSTLNGSPMELQPR